VTYAPRFLPQALRGGGGIVACMMLPPCLTLANGAQPSMGAALLRAAMGRQLQKVSRGGCVLVTGLAGFGRAGLEPVTCSESLKHAGSVVCTARQLYCLPDVPLVHCTAARCYTAVVYCCGVLSPHTMLYCPAGVDRPVACITCTATGNG
jgi:hypothetical protein